MRETAHGGSCSCHLRINIHELGSFFVALLVFTWLLSQHTVVFPVMHLRNFPSSPPRYALFRAQFRMVHFPDIINSLRELLLAPLHQSHVHMSRSHLSSDNDSKTVQQELSSILRSFLPYIGSIIHIHLDYLLVCGVLVDRELD